MTISSRLERLNEIGIGELGQKFLDIQTEVEEIKSNLDLNMRRIDDSFHNLYDRHHGMSEVESLLHQMKQETVKTNLFI